VRFPDLVLTVDRCLCDAGIDHAFGGAIALSYYADPRATQDADINIFLPFERAAAVVGTLSEVGLEPELSAAEWSPSGGIRLAPVAGGAFRVDLFLSIDERYATIARRARRVPFGSPPSEILILSLEDLVLFKLSFGRGKDWVDIGQIASAGFEPDLDYIEEQLIGLRGPALYPRLARARALFE